MDEKYKRIKVLGKGSFGKAYLVQNTEADAMCVVKQMETSMMDQKDRNLAVKEAMLLKSMDHPNIVRFQEVFMTRKGRLCIVMDYADGGDVHTRIRQQEGQLLPEIRVLEWFVQTCFALKHVHDRKVLHRDLKSQNIFLMATGHVKLGDFGIARVLDATKDYAKTMVGTPYYLSPEIIGGRLYNLKSDVWSLGVVLYEMATLKHPFSADALVDLASKILKDQCPPISEEYSQDLAALIRSMLSKDAKPRPSVGEILSLPFLQEAMHGANERYSLGLDLSPYTPVRVEPEAPSPNGASRAEAGLEEGQEEEDDYEEEDFEDYSEDGSEDGAEKAPQTEAQLELQESVAALKLAAGSAASVAAPGAGGQGGGQGVREKADSLRAYLRGQAPSFEDGYRLLRGAGDAPDAEDLRQEFSGLVGADKAPQLFPLFQLLCFLEDVSADAPESV